MNPVARVRHLLARHRRLYWSAVLTIAGVGGWSIATAVAGVDDARRAWGDTSEVVVATDDIAPGDPIPPHTEVRPRPVPMIPAAAIASVPAGATARQHVAAGEVLVEVDVAATGDPQALIPRGWVGVAVVEVVPTGAAIGDRVAAVSGAVVLAADAVVVGHAAEATLVAVPADEAPHVAEAASAGDLALLLVP